MRDFTPEEKELIVNTPITVDCFETDDFENMDTHGTANCHSCWDLVIFACEGLRQHYNETKDKRYLKELIRLLPNSYKVVNLCAEQEKKDFCIYKHKVSGKKVSVSSIGTTSDAFPCYEVYSCDKCDYFKM